MARRRAQKDYWRLDVRRWQRDGLLTPGTAFGWKWTRYEEIIASIQVQVEEGRVLLIYRHRRSAEGWKDEHYPVYLDWTPCHLGGSRASFLCPAKGCGRRVAALYGGAIFACRHCYRLAYPSQRETSSDRLARRADKIRERLGWEPGILNLGGWKPKGMHWSTFQRLTAEHDALVARSVAGMESHLSRLRASLARRD